MEYIFAILLVLIFGFLIWDKVFNKQNLDTGLNDKNQDLFKELERVKIDLENKTLKIGELTREIEEEKKQRNTLEGRGREYFANNTELKSQNGALQQDNLEMKKQITRYESDKLQKEKIQEQKIQELENARKALEDERLRIRREDEERLKKAEEDRDRIWKEHENKAVNSMREVCGKDKISLVFYDNNNLPEDFDGGLKPDFLVEFLNQYIIFDAKVSKTEDRLQDYLKQQVKSTVRKIKDSSCVDQIYKSVFFIVPSSEINKLTELSFYEDGYHFYIISIESFEPVLATFKKVEGYSLAERFDPKDREDIVSLIASYDHHISKQNTLNIMGAMEGLKVMNSKEGLNHSLLSDVEIKKKQIKPKGISGQELKKYISDMGTQVDTIKGMISAESKAKIEIE